MKEICPVCGGETLKIGQVNGEMVGYCDNCGFCPDERDIMGMSGIENAGDGNFVAINELGRQFLKSIDTEKKKLKARQTVMLPIEQKEG